MGETLNESPRLATFTLGEAITDSPTVLNGLYFNMTDIFGGVRSSCDFSERSKTEYVINGTALEQEWIYADFF